MAEFKLDERRIEVPEVPDLDEGEKEQLRALMQPGGSLWKIMRRMLDYGEDLKQSLIEADLDDDADRKAARKVQATIAASYWATQTFVQAVQPAAKSTKETREDV
jgi:hypothetical protein